MSIRGTRLTFACAAALILASAQAHAQKSTEQFIPIGLSPGISGRSTSIATIDSTNLRLRVLAMNEGGVRRTVKLTPRTRIFLDRSRLKLPNLEGSVEDLIPGRRIEVKFENPVLRQVADWVKIEIPKP